jgi:hypothetical protein
MQCPIPPLRLIHVPLLWTLGQGVSPQGPRRRLLLDQLRYLRQLDMPFAEQGRGKGRGRAIRYAYEEVVEMAVALFALRHGVRPHLVADYLVTNRTTLHRLFCRALEAQPATALKASWLKSRGRQQAVPAHELFLRLHNRMRHASGSYELVTPWTAQELGALCRQEELFPDGPPETHVPLTRLVLDVTYWAEQAQDIKPGRKVKGVHALKRHGHGTLTLEAPDHHITDIGETAPSSEGASRGHIRGAMAIQIVRGDPSTDARVNDPFRAV